MSHSGVCMMGGLRRTGERVGLETQEAVEGHVEWCLWTVIRTQGSGREVEWWRGEGRRCK